MSQPFVSSLFAKILTSILTLILLSLSVSSVASAEEFVLGRDYVELDSPLSTQQSNTLGAVKEVREFYSFFCGHCFKQEAFIHELAKILPADVALNKNHVNGMPGQQLAMEDALTKALITAQLLKVEAVIVEAVFNRIHIDRQGFNSVEDIKTLFVEKGVPEADFDKTFASFMVTMEAKKMLGYTASLRQQGIGGVPTLIINGKYKPEVSQIKDMDQYKRLISYLVNKDS